MQELIIDIPCAVIAVVLFIVLLKRCTKQRGCAAWKEDALKPSRTYGALYVSPVKSSFFGELRSVFLVDTVSKEYFHIKSRCPIQAGELYKSFSDSDGIHLLMLDSKSAESSKSSS